MGNRVFSGRGLPKFEDLAIAPLTDVDLVQCVRSITLDNGAWDWDYIKTHLPESVCLHIARILPPRGFKW